MQYTGSVEHYEFWINDNGHTVVIDSINGHEVTVKTRLSMAIAYVRGNFPYSTPLQGVTATSECKSHKGTLYAWKHALKVLKQREQQKNRKHVPFP